MIETIMDALGIGSPEVIGYDQLKVKCPYPLQHIHGLEIEWKPGEHAKLQLTGWMDEDIQMQMPLAASVQDQIEVTYGSFGAEQPLFRGLVNKVEAIRQNNRHEIVIEGISASSLWDIQKRKRTFPEQTQTYEELISKINTDYPGSSIAFHKGSDQETGEAILQYEETDWALTKRLASRLQTVVVCDMLESVKPRLHFGLPEGKTVTVPDDVPYTARKDLKAYQQAGGSEAGLHDTDFFRYELQHIEPFAIGDRVTFRDKKLVVREVHAIMDKGQLLFNYVLSREPGVRSLLITNPKAIGVSLEGTVLAVRGEEVKLKLDVDKDDGKADPHWYPFAPPTGGPMYSMPQVGTKASLYHPDGTGTRAQIIGSVRTNGASAPKTSDPNIRYYGSEHGSELKMAPDHVHVHGNPAGTMAISLEDGVGVTIRSPKKLTITGKEDIVLFSKKKVIIQAGEQIMAYKTGGTSGIAIEGEYHLLGEKVWADGSDRTAYAAYQDEPQKGTPPPPPDPPKPFDWGKLGRNVLGGLAIVVGVAALAAFTVATLGAGPVIVGAVAVGAMAAGGIAVGVQAASDIARGEVSDFGEYAKTALRESLIGAVTGAIFGPLGVGGSIAGKMALGGAENAVSDIASQMMQGKKFSEIDWKSVGMSAGLGVATVGVVNSKAGKALGNAIVTGAKKTPTFIKNGAKASVEAFQNSLKKLSETGSKLSQKIKSELDNMMSPQMMTAEGLPIRLNESANVKNVEIPKTEVQKNYLKVMEQAEGTSLSVKEKQRLIPGTPGEIEISDSTKLGKNLLETMGLKRSDSWSGYQAQHIIPGELYNHPIIEKIGMEINHASNGIFLPIPSSKISPMSRHTGYHSIYNRVVKKQLDKMDINASVEVLENQVYELQQKLKKAVEQGLPLYKSKIPNQRQLKRMLKKPVEDRMEIWDRGGGATEELWERWINK